MSVSRVCFGFGLKKKTESIEHFPSFAVVIDVLFIRKAPKNSSFVTAQGEFRWEIDRKSMVLGLAGGWGSACASDSPSVPLQGVHPWAVPILCFRIDGTR